MHKLLPVLLLGMMVALGACEKKEERILPKTGSAEQVDAEQQSRLDREAFISQAQNEIDELDIKLTDIRKKAMDATGKAKEKLTQRISALEQERKNVEEKLAGLRMEMGEKWKDLKAGVSAAIEQFRQSVKNAN